MKGAAAPPSTLTNLLKFCYRQVWASKSYMSALPPKRTWRVPPLDERTEKDASKPGMSVFFYPTSTVKKHAAYVRGPYGKLEERIPWTALDIVSLPRNPQTHEIRYYADNGTKSFVANAISGVHEGYAVVLELVGVGFRAEQQDDCIHLRVGFTHPLELPYERDGVKARILQPTKVQLYGTNLRKVHRAAAQLRKIRPPDAYKGKGIRYEGELVRTKPGKKNE